MNDFVAFLTKIFGNEDVATNLIASGIYSLPAGIIALFTWLGWKNFSRHRLPFSIRLKVIRSRINSRLRGPNFSIDGFYYAVYVATKDVIAPKPSVYSDLKNARKSGTKGERSESTRATRVAECIYIEQGLYSSRVKGHIFRRAKRKNGKIDENKHYGALTGLRIVGSFSYAHQIFCGYWLDPFNPKDVAGTVTLKWVDDNVGVDSSRRRHLFVGHWDGYDKDKVPKTTTESSDPNFKRIGGTWRFIRIGSTLSEFSAWRLKLEAEKDHPSDPKAFLDWPEK